MKKIRFESNDDLPINKPIKINLLTIIIRYVFSEGGKSYPQFFLFVKILQYERIDVSEGIDINKTCLPKEIKLCHYWYFKNTGFKFEEHVFNGCHDLLTMVHSLENIAILSPKEATFRCILWGISKNEGLRILNNSVLEDKGVL